MEQKGEGGGGQEWFCRRDVNTKGMKNVFIKKRRTESNSGSLLFSQVAEIEKERER